MDLKLGMKTESLAHLGGLNYSENRIIIHVKTLYITKTVITMMKNSSEQRKAFANKSRFGGIAKHVLFEIMLPKLHFIICNNPAHQTLKF